VWSLWYWMYIVVAHGGWWWELENWMKMWECGLELLHGLTLGETKINYIN